MGFLVFCNTNINGDIAEGVCGFNIAPDKQYDHFFYLEKPIDLMEYKVLNGELTKKGES